MKIEEIEKISRKSLISFFELQKAIKNFLISIKMDDYTNIDNHEFIDFYKTVMSLNHNLTIDDVYYLIDKTRDK